MPRSTDSNGARVLATAAKHVLSQHLDDLVSELPEGVGLYRPACWTPGPSDDEYSSVMDLNCFEPCRQVLDPLVHAFHAFVEGGGGAIGGLAEPKVRIYFWIHFWWAFGATTPHFDNLTDHR